jgi:hypothetical protein
LPEQAQPFFANTFGGHLECMHNDKKHASNCPFSLVLFRHFRKMKTIAEIGLATWGLLGATSRRQKLVLACHACLPGLK